MKSVLLLTDVNFWEKSSGNRSRIHALVKYLATNVKLTVVNTGPAPEGIENKLAAEFDAEFFVLEKKRYLSSTGYGRKLGKILKGREFDVTIIEYIHSSYFINFLEGDTRLILDAHDLISKRAIEFARFGYAGELYEISEETEKEILAVYDHVMVLCAEDAAFVDEAAGAGKGFLCPHPVETKTYPQNASVRSIVFTGSAYLPNCDGIEWFIENCWPRIKNKYAVELLIFGTVGSAINTNMRDGIILKGFVDDIELIYSQADIVINPVRFGAGIKIKNVEALAYGRPLVTTSHSARGLTTNGEAFLVADSADEFTENLGMLIENFNLRQTLSANALKFAQYNLVAEECFKPLMEYIYG